MSVQDIAALMRRHLAALMVVIIAAAAVAVIFKRTPVTYRESGTVVFSAPGSANFPNPYTSFSGSLVDAAGLIALFVMSPRDQRQIEAEGGAAAYDAALVNVSDLEYPDFSDPYITVTAVATDPMQVHRTFALVTRELYSELSSRQARANVSVPNRITASLIGDSGTLAQPGSSKRVDAGLLALAIIAALSVAIFLDRHSLRPNRIFRGVGSRAARPVGDRQPSRFREQPAP